ncbi:hypothetical protein V5799_025777 [Amblyomma americanum]|uniref:Uncharacterized protein n=1 Tax=Amblyomma americanum TaxID=6943 RepID=A0AAQ4E8I7_AMBAM
MAVGFLMGTATVSLLDLMSVIGGNSAVTVVVSGTYLTYYMLENMSSSGVTGVVVYTMAVNLHRSVACTELARALEEYLDMDTIGSILAIPQWVIWLKENMGTAREEGLTEDSGVDVIQRPLRERVVELFEHSYYEAVVTSSTLAIVFVLAGLLRILMVTARSSAFIAAISVEALYLTMFTTEVTVMISAYGQRIVNMDNYNRLDLVLVASCMFIFTMQCGLFLMQQNDLANSALIVCFIGAVSLRFLHAAKYAERVLERVADYVHRYLDAKIYDAYQIGHAIVTGEEEVQQNVWKFVSNNNTVAEIRGRATLNRLLVLRRLVEIQSRFPGVMVAFRSRQASTTILDDVTRNIQDHQSEGLLDAEAAQELCMTWPLDKISRRLESFLLPDLERCSKFNLTADIEDAILIHGIALDPETQEYFVAPAYLPPQTMKITFPFHQNRLRPVMMIIASKTYRLPPEVDWLQTKVDDEKQTEYEDNFKMERGDDLTDKVLSHRQSVELY